MTNQVEDRSTEIIGDIQNLQNIEADLFKTLENGLANKTLTAEQQTSLVEQINKVSSMREDMYKSLDRTQNYYRGTVSRVGDIIGHQINALDVVETQMNESKKRLKTIEEEKNNKLRLVEINTYYGEQYADNTEILKTIVYFCIPIIILALLANANMIPHSIYVVLFIIIIVIGVVVVWRQILKALSHDNMNYQEYVWGNAVTNTPPVSTDNPTGTDPWKGVGLTCVAQECCDTGFTYVPSPINKCAPNDKLPTGVKPYDPMQSQSLSSSTNGIFSSGTPTQSAVTKSVSGKLTTANPENNNNSQNTVASIYDAFANI